jgi:hypothetical protein
MDKVVLVPSLTLGLIFICIYIFRCWKNDAEFNVGVMISATFQASGVVCGIFLIIGIFSEELRALMTGIDIYIFVSGLAVLAVSLQAFHKDAIKGTKISERQSFSPEAVSDEVSSK